MHICVFIMTKKLIVLLKFSAGIVFQILFLSQGPTFLPLFSTHDWEVQICQFSSYLKRDIESTGIKGDAKGGWFKTWSDIVYEI